MVDELVIRRPLRRRRRPQMQPRSCPNLLYAPHRRPPRPSLGEVLRTGPSVASRSASDTSARTLTNALLMTHARDAKSHIAVNNFFGATVTRWLTDEDENQSSSLPPQNRVRHDLATSWNGEPHDKSPGPT